MKQQLGGGETYKETDGEKRRCPMCNEENEINVVLKFNETEMARKILEHCTATHKSRNSSSNNNQLYQDYKI